LPGGAANAGPPAKLSCCRPSEEWAMYLRNVRGQG
jgi:hypothetical protein